MDYAVRRVSFLAMVFNDGMAMVTIALHWLSRLLYMYAIWDLARHRRPLYRMG